MGREGKGREGKGREEKGSKGKEREGKGREEITRSATWGRCSYNLQSDQHVC